MGRLFIQKKRMQTLINVKKHAKLNKKEEKRLQNQIIPLTLHRVFHSIRFKVNKGWSTAVLLFLFIDLFYLLLPLV